MLGCMSGVPCKTGTLLNNNVGKLVGGEVITTII